MEGLQLFEVYDETASNDVIARVEAFTAEDALRKFKRSRPEFIKSRSEIHLKVRNVYDKNRSGYLYAWSSDDNDGYY